MDFKSLMMYFLCNHKKYQDFGLNKQDDRDDQKEIYVTFLLCVNILIHWFWGRFRFPLFRLTNLVYDSISILWVNPFQMIATNI